MHLSVWIGLDVGVGDLLLGILSSFNLLWSGALNSSTFSFLVPLLIQFSMSSCVISVMASKHFWFMHVSGTLQFVTVPSYTVHALSVELPQTTGVLLEVHINCNNKQRYGYFFSKEQCHVSSPMTNNQLLLSTRQLAKVFTWNILGTGFCDSFLKFFNFSKTSTHCRLWTPQNRGSKKKKKKTQFQWNKKKIEW